MFYTAPMSFEGIEQLARELSQRDKGLEQELEQTRVGALALHERASRAVARFTEIVTAEAAGHLGGLETSPLEPDEKHVDCLQFKVRRGRWEIVLVAKARPGDDPKVTLVGPYKKGKQETPCHDHALAGEAVESALDQLIEALIREGCAR
jgi:hypothetical protein